MRGFKHSVSLKKLETFIIPQPGEGIAEVEILQWLVKPNEKIHEFQILCEARSDKGFIEYKSPFDGTITELLYKPSDMAQIGSALFKAEVPDQNSTTAPEEPEPILSLESILSKGKVLTTPYIRNLAKQQGLDLTKVHASGADGRILISDVEEYMKTLKSPKIQSQKKDPNQPEGKIDTSFLENPKHVQPPPMPKVEVHLEDKVIKMTPVQKAMMKSMTEALLIPHLTYCEDIYMEQVIELRRQLKSNIKDVKLTYMPFFVKALSLAILDYPIVNSVLNEAKNEYLIKGSHNVSFAMDTPNGLVVPNIKDVEVKSIYEIAKEMNRLQDLGHQGKLGPNDLKDGTIAISNIGTIGGTYASPVIMPPQVFIGAFGAIRPRLEKVNGEIVEKQILKTGWSADHRVLDGATTARFVARWKAIIENPSLMLLHLK